MHEEVKGAGSPPTCAIMLGSFAALEMSRSENSSLSSSRLLTAPTRKAGEDRSSTDVARRFVVRAANK